MKKNGIILNGVIILRRKYMKKGHSIIEVGLLLCFVVVISLAAITIYNNQKTNLAYLSKPTIPLNLNKTSDADKLKEPICNPAYNKVETAGTNALIKLGISAENYEATMANLSYARLKSFATGGNDDIFTLANKLKDALGVTCDSVNPEKVTAATLSSFTEILNAAVAALNSNDTPQSVKDQANNYIAQVKSMLNYKS